MATQREEPRRFDAAFTVTNPDAVRFKLELTMDLHDWKKLREQLERMEFPAMYLHETVCMMVQQAEKQIESPGVHIS